MDLAGSADAGGGGGVWEVERAAEVVSCCADDACELLFGLLPPFPQDTATVSDITLNMPMVYFRCFLVFIFLSYKDECA